MAETITAIELISAAEALEYRKPLRPDRDAQQAYEIVRKYVARVTADRSMSGEIETIAKVIRDGEFDAVV